MADSDGLAAEPVGVARARTEGGMRQRIGNGHRPAPMRSAPEVRRALAPIEFTFDLRETPPEKVLGRLFAGLDRISGDVTLLVLLRDTPELVGVTANAFHLLRTRGYASDMSRLPSGGQRLTIRPRNRRVDAGAAPASDVAEHDYVPAPTSASDASAFETAVPSQFDDGVAGPIA
ncbi:MAG: hypothetical protein NTX54_04350 [Chloroflexi bacterium]|nr:hypothetical protein [Chloroflexota bacterium]